MFLAGFLSFHAEATHLVGGEIYYDCITADQLKITLKLYRDCGPNNELGTGYDNLSYISFFDTSGYRVSTVSLNFPGATQLPVAINDPCMSAPPSICFEEAIYTGTIFLPKIAGGLDMVYQRCCRSPGVVNLLNPRSQGSTYVIHIPDTAITKCNSSPRFNNAPPLVICMGQPFEFDHSAIDPDGDSLVYELCEPFQGASPSDPRPTQASAPPYFPIVWDTSYSASYPIPSDPAFTIDPHTGILKGKANQQGQFTFGICVKEYRDGVLLSENKRDFQITVAFCETTKAEIPDQTVFCEGLSIQMINNSNVNGNYFWDFGDHNNIHDTSSLFNPPYTYTDSGTYTITLISNPGLWCADTATKLYTVMPLLKPIIPPVDGQCLIGNSFDFVIGGILRDSTKVLWDFTTMANPDTSTSRTPKSIHFSDTGYHSISLTYFDYGCQKVDTETVIVYPHPDPKFNISDVEGCKPLTVHFENNAFAWTPMKFLWDFGDSTYSSDENPIHVYLNEGRYKPTLTAWTDDGCIDTVSRTYPGAIQVNPLPTAGFSMTPAEASIFEPIFEFLDESSDRSACKLFLGNGDSSDLCTFTYEYGILDTGYFNVMQVVVNEYGCFDTAYQQLRVNPEFTFYVPNAFTPNGDGMNEVFLPMILNAHEYDFYVYSRWGELIFHTTNTLEGWDGSVNSAKLAPPGVYSYVIKLVDFKGRGHEQNGSITLIR